MQLTNYLASIELNNLHAHTPSMKENSENYINSIYHADIIQSALFSESKNELINSMNNFVFYQPKEKVGGDFYWYGEQDSKRITVCADCTGHGVQGAMLSLIGYMEIDRIIRSLRLTDPGEILTVLHKTFSRNLQFQEAIFNMGMDISICVYDEFRKELKVASAKGKCIISTNGLFLKMPSEMVGIGEAHHPDHVFKTHTYPVDQATYLFQFSDGFTDQFGGPEGKKYKVKRVLDQLNSFQYLELAEYHAYLVGEFNKWKMYEEQTDDITLIGNFFSPL